MIERKCLKCSTWNGEEDFCVNCGEPLSPKEIQKKEDALKKIELENKPKDKLDILMERAKNSKYLVVRWMFYSAYSVGVMVAAIGSFLAYLVAWTAG